MRATVLARNGETATQVWTLSPREAQLLFLVVRGEGNKQIAYQLGMADSTVQMRLWNMMAALGLHNKLELCVWGLQHPEAMKGIAAPAGLHPVDCTCQKGYCATMRQHAPALAT